MVEGPGLGLGEWNEGKEDGPISPGSELGPLGFVRAESCVQEGSPSGVLDGCVEMRPLCPVEEEPGTKASARLEWGCVRGSGITIG